MRRVKFDAREKKKEWEVWSHGVALHGSAREREMSLKKKEEYKETSGQHGTFNHQSW